MLIVSFIRHGESLDNLLDAQYVAQRSVWAGHSDAELSELGVRQAKALGDAYANVRLDAIITSDLKRAHATAVALLNGQQDPQPSFRVDRDLREQSFGDAEGHSWQLHRTPHKSIEDHFRDGRYPVLFERHEKFPNGESLDDVAARAERVIRDLVLKPYLFRGIFAGDDVHVALVSHGLCISEMIPALLKWNDGGAPAKDYRGLLNTAWSRAIVAIKPGLARPVVINAPATVPPLVVAVTEVNRHEHITNVKRQRGIVKDDSKQQGIREFFGGGGPKMPVDAAEHAESNALDHDEVMEDCE